MTHFARTRNAVPVRADAVPCVEIEIFRREVLQAIAAGGRLLLLTRLSQKNGETRLLAAIAGDAGAKSRSPQRSWAGPIRR